MIRCILHAFGEGTTSGAIADLLNRNGIHGSLPSHPNP